MDTLLIERTTLHIDLILSNLSINSRGLTFGFSKSLRTNGESVSHLYTHDFSCVGGNIVPMNVQNCEVKKNDISLQWVILYNFIYFLYPRGITLTHSFFFYLFNFSHFFKFRFTYQINAIE